MTQQPYVPPRAWTYDKPDGGPYAALNRPTAGATHEKDLPVGRHPLQLYSLATPNGQKVTIFLEELLEAGYDAEYDAWLVRISEGEQFSSGFVAINPNSKIPVLVDRGSHPPQRVFESGAILLYLAEKFGAFLPEESGRRTAALSWLFWQMGSSPLLGGGFGHFYAYAPDKHEYAINRFTMEVKRQLDVLDQHLAGNEFIAGDIYSLADMAIWPWYGRTVLGNAYDAGEFLGVESYSNLLRWAKMIEQRPAVQRGAMVNRINGPLHLQLHERHERSDFAEKTADKNAP